ncbi:hypothetical protein BC629DRAFT_1596637 [Irpex lacteus]|nr:hypothetical protein BC629DRAFT_1596637 [Irpex lacteus]
MTSQVNQKPRVNTAHLPVPTIVSPTSSTDGDSISPLLPAFVPRPSASRHTTSQSLSVPSNGSLTLIPQHSSSNVSRVEGLSHRLLMPTTRETRPSHTFILPKSSKFSPSKHSRSRAGSLVHTVPPSPDPNASPPTSVDWVGGGCRFEVVEEQIELWGYQIYAVEKWVVDRHRPVTVLTVLTGDPNHKITVTAISPSSNLSSIEAQLEWEKAIHLLRRDGARPKETNHGVIMVTSLANFRSDFTIVHIPGGNYLDVREQLYTNINVLRMGCSGRSALTLEEPSETTKDRFISSYYIPDKSVMRSPGLFKAVCSSSSSLCRLHWPSAGIQRWIAEVGEPLWKEWRIPQWCSTVSLVLTARNRLNGLGQYVPKDPFIDPPAFVKASTLMAAKQHGHSHSMSFPTIYLSITAAYDKGKQNESYKVHRVLINKLDDLATDLRTNPDPDTRKGSFSSASNLNPTTKLDEFVRVITANSKDGSPSVRYLWTGRPGDVARKRREREAIWSEGEEKEREREKEIEEKERERIERDRDRDGVKSSEDEMDFMGGIPWSGRVQRKLESWAAIGRGKKSSVDFGGRVKGFESPLRGQPTQPIPTLPSVVVSREQDDDDILTSGQVSPVSDTHTKNPFRLGVDGLSQARRSSGELSDYDRKVTEFNQRNPPTRPYAQTRIVSWADPQTAARDSLGDEEESRLRRGPSPAPRPISQEDPGEGEESFRPKRIDLQALKRCRSFDDVDALRGTRILPPERMRIDVELCGQTLMLRRREEHLQNVIACLEALTSTLSASNSTLRQDQTSKQTAIDALYSRAGVLQDIEAMRAHADAMTQETNALAYESAQFLVDDLWHMAAAPRAKVLAVRERVFGTGRRLPQGVKGAHGRFNRMQWTLDGGTRLVDVHGRTESEAEEEVGLPWIRPVYEEEEEEDVVEHANLKPTWLLRFFNYWGSKWGTPRNASKKSDGPEDAEGTDRREPERRQRALLLQVDSSCDPMRLPEITRHRVILAYRAT